MNFEFLEYINIEVIVAILAALVIYLLYVVLTKDAQYARHIRSLADAIEGLNRDVYYLKKKVEDAQKSLNSMPKRMGDDEIYQEIERASFDMIKPLSIAIKNLQNDFGNLDSSLNGRISDLQSSIKQISLPSSLQSSDDEKIVQLYRQGISLDVIAKELHISKAEAEFVLKINKIK